MSAELQIGIDPTVWTFDPAGFDEVATAQEHPAPFTIDVTAPMVGRLIINPRAAGKVVLNQPISPRGWNPSGGGIGTAPLLYLPSVSGPSVTSPGYLLAAKYEVPVLERDIEAAMSAGTMLTLDLEPGPPDKGVVVLSGGALAFAVLCRAVA
ncbi:MAG: hypothetical protein ACLPKI_30520 [Streptosporangiaceae bacterium]